MNVVDYTCTYKPNRELIMLLYVERPLTVMHEYKQIVLSPIKLCKYHYAVDKTRT